MQICLPSPEDVEKAIAILQTTDPRLNAFFTQYGSMAKALRQLGLSLWGEGQHASASTVLTASAALEPQDAAIWNDLAGVYYGSAQPIEALAAIEISLQKDSEQPYGWLILATLHNEAENDAGAEAAFRRALQLAPDMAEAAFGLGLVYFRQKRYVDAEKYLRAAIENGTPTQAHYLCLGQVLYLQGNFRGVAVAFTAALAFNPQDRPLTEKLALLRLIETVIIGSVEDALASYSETLGTLTGNLLTATQTAFHLLSGYGHHEAARKLGMARLEWVPEDKIQRYLVAALNGEPLTRAPVEYVRAHFDQFAEGFDSQLVEVLGYRVPQELHALTAEIGLSFDRILDLGCGTGLAAPFLNKFGAHMTGVDLSPGMLSKAATRGLYHNLAEAEAVTFLAGTTDSFDLIFAADFLVYIGDISELFTHAASAIKTNGLFVFSIETTFSRDYSLLPSGRFAHNPTYILEVTNRDFKLLRRINTTIRLEANAPVSGELFVLQRR